MRKIIYFTGSRAEYGLMRSLLKTIDDNPNFELNLIVTGTHLSKKYGYTLEAIKKDRFKIISEIEILKDVETKLSMIEAFSKCVLDAAKVLEKDKPDILLLQGDRSETLAAAIAASHLDIPIAHMSGGDITCGGTIDDFVRSAISDFSHIHFPSTKRSKDVLIKKGEEPWRVHFVGNPGVNLRNESFTNSEELINKLSINLKKEFIVVIQHPVKPEQAEKQMEETMSAIKELDMQAVVIYPNSDSGSQDIIKVIKKYENNLIKSYKTLSRSDFVGLLKLTKALVGNSSCGIAEAPSLNLPVVNIGKRQEGREKMSNVIDVDHNKEQIKEAIKRAINMEENIDLKKIPYYAENSEEEIVKILLETELNENLLKKKVVL